MDGHSSPPMNGGGLLPLQPLPGRPRSFLPVFLLEFVTMKKIVLGLSAAAIALGAGALYAATPAQPPMAGMHHGADADGDGAVTWAEAKAKADAAWVKFDVNKDGKLDQADRDAKLGQKFDAIDTNHDGAISRDEFVAHHRDMMQHGMMPPKDDMAGHDMNGHEMGRPEGHRMGGHRMGGHDMMGGMMTRMSDANKDGTVTRAEYDAAAKARFDKADANHDGKVTVEERRAAFKAMRPRARDGEAMGQMPPPPPGE